MVETLTAIAGALVGLITAGSIGYSKIKQLQNEHVEKLKALDNEKEIKVAEAGIKLAEAEEKLKTAEDRRQNEAFDRLKQSFDTLQQMFNDLLTRTQNLEESEKACQARVAVLTQEMEKIKKG
jgi:chromosome segregation ATPase